MQRSEDESLSRAASTTRRHPLLGIAASALAGPSAFFAYRVVEEIGAPDFGPQLLTMTALMHYYFGLMITLPVSLAVGLPYVLWLQRRGRLDWTRVCVGATVVGALALSAFWLLGVSSYPLYVFAALGAGCGLLSGAAFCAVVRPA